MLILLFFEIVSVVLCIIILAHRVGRNKDVVLNSFDLPTTGMLKGLMAIAIVLCHFSICVGSKMPMGGRLAATGLPIVAVFFFISGYGLLNSLIRKGNEYLKTFLTHRLLKIVIPLIIVVFVNIIVDVCMGIEFPSKIELWNQFIHDSPYLWYSWFVYALLFLYILYYIIFSVVKSVRLGVAIMSISVLVMILYFTNSHIFIFARSTMFAFPLGMICRLAESRIKGRMIRSAFFSVFSYCLMLFLALFVMLFMKKNDIPEDPENLVGRIVVYLTPFIIYFASFVVKIKENISTYINKLGKISYEIYLIHGVVLSHSFFYGYNLVLQFIIVYAMVIIGAILVNNIDQFILRRLSI